MKNYAAVATQYARDVVDGRVLAGRFVVLACQRHLDDLKRDDVYFDEAAANKVCGFIELLPHVKGRWMGQNIVLEPWQCFVIGVAFGWMRMDGLRRFRRAYWEVPRKNAKSTISAGVGLYMFCEDDEGGAEVYSGATSEKQAWEVFGPARLMAKKTPELCDHYGVHVGAKTLSRAGVNAKFEPIIGNPGDGASPHFAIIDEYHEHKDDRQYDTMDTGMGAREQPMIWTITTAGSDTSGPCYQLRGDLVAVLEGDVVDDSFCGAVWTIDKEDAWTDDRMLEKANPNFGVSVFEDYLLGQKQKALNSPRKQSAVKTKHYNVWVGAADPYFNSEKWRELADPSLDAMDFVGDECFAGVDLAEKWDLSVYGKLFRRVVDEKQHFYWFPRFYLPEEQVHRHQSYQGWVIQGHIEETPGNITDLDTIEDEIKADSETFAMEQLGYDPRNAQHMMGHLSDHGVECVEVPQTVNFLSEPMKWVGAMIEDGRLHHDGNPVMSWCIGNVTAQADRNENVFPRKEHRQNKIDGAVALIIAMGRAWTPPEDGGSYLDTSEELFVL